MLRNTDQEAKHSIMNKSIINGWKQIMYGSY